jgi:hypothetical protein
MTRYAIAVLIALAAALGAAPARADDPPVALGEPAERDEPRAVHDDVLVGTSIGLGAFAVVWGAVWIGVQSRLNDLAHDPEWMSYREMTLMGTNACTAARAGVVRGGTDLAHVRAICDEGDVLDPLLVTAISLTAAAVIASVSVGLFDYFESRRRARSVEVAVGLGSLSVRGTF